MSINPESAEQDFFHVLKADEIDGDGQAGDEERGKMLTFSLGCGILNPVQKNFIVPPSGRSIPTHQRL